MTEAASVTGWTDPGDGFLVLKRKHDGSVDHGSERLVDATLLPGDNNASSGYQLLSDLGTGYDSRPINTDINFADLKVWTALASDGTGDSYDAGTIGLVSSDPFKNRQLPVLADVWLPSDKPQHTAATRSELTVAPTDMQLDVAGLVDAMAHFGNNPLLKGADVSADGGDTAVLRTTAPVVASNLTRQLVLALSQFDANGNAVLGQATQQNTFSGLTESDPSKPPHNTAGLLTVGKG